jgi:hypothetical protein
MRGVDNNGYDTGASVVTGYLWVASGKSRELDEFNERWPYLIIEADAVTPQFTVTFINDDGTVLDVQYVDAESLPVDPVTRTDNPIPTPTKESTISTNYEYNGWNAQFAPVWSDQTFKATYNETTREYTVQYVANNNVLQTTTAPYGSMVEYEGDTPTYTAGESSRKYHLFEAWDKSGYVNGDKTINAVFDSCQYVDKYFDNKVLSDLRPVEIYMMIKLSAAGLISLTDYLDPKDSITIRLGNDFSYANEDIEEQVLIAEKTVFNGSNYVDTEVNLLSEDRDFVLAIDYKIDSGNSANSVLAQCFSGLDTSGFKLSYSNGAKLAWGSTSTNTVGADVRDMIVLRHIKGENGVHVYSSDTAMTDSRYAELSGIHPMVHNVSLVFGCSKLEDGSYEQFGKGTIYWSKVWYADLGDAMCKQLVAWPHEEFGLDVCFEYKEDGAPNMLKRYYLSDNTGARSSITFVSSGVLLRSMSLGNSYATTGGWAESTLNTYLNNRIHKAFPVQWKQLIKQVRVTSSIGDKAEATSNSDCYIFIPSISELYSSFTNEPYITEGTPISHFTDNHSRICYDENGNAVSYWTRSPNVAYENYQYNISNTGAHYGYSYPTDTHHVRIMISI